ncbi:MAG: YabP/YqfC family sporulation protein [Eubacteriales bacterium]|nr:YabP/YqfC family sporulation protein [Eubacteriales bacterium]
MGKGGYFLRRLTDEADLSVLPGHPIVELAGDRRVLIENHRGVKEYGCTRITVGMCYGQVSILGEGLQILRMTAEQLVICGKISGVSLQRRAVP